jgi:hypothetical protein
VESITETCGSSEICGSSVEKLILFCTETFNYVNNEAQKKEFPPICTFHSNAAHNKPTKTPYCTTHLSLRTIYTCPITKQSVSGTGRKYWSTTSNHSMALPCSSGVHRNFVREGFNKYSWGQRERGSGGRSPLVRGSGGSCNFVQEISFHILQIFLIFGTLDYLWWQPNYLSLLMENNCEPR